MKSMEPSQAPTLDDAALLERYAGAADAAAFAELVRRYAGMVYATARRVTGDPSAAEDVSQDCFLRLARASQDIRGSLPAWLHRTSLNRSLEVVRSDRARRRREAQASPAGAARGEAGGDSAQLIAHVDAAMGKLPDELRTILTEHFLCGRTQSEIAAELKVDQSTVSRRIERGLDELRGRLRAEGVAIAALPAVLTATDPPPTLHAVLSKIGLSGVRGGGSASAAAAASSFGAAAAVVATSAAVILLVVAGALWFRSANRGSTPRPGAAPAIAGSVPATAPTTARSARDDDDEEEDDEEDDEDEMDENENEFELFGDR